MKNSHVCSSINADGGSDVRFLGLEKNIAK